MKKDKLGRNAPLHYSESFKRKVIEEYLTTGVPKMDLVRKYGIRYKSGITKWMQSLGYLEPKRKVINLALLNETGVARPKKLPEPGSAEAEIARLKRELEDERLRSEMYLRMIDIAERDYKVPIRKKPVTK